MWSVVQVTLLGFFEYIHRACGIDTSGPLLDTGRARKDLPDKLSFSYIMNFGKLFLLLARPLCIRMLLPRYFGVTGAVGW